MDDFEYPFGLDSEWSGLFVLCESASSETQLAEWPTKFTTGGVNDNIAVLTAADTLDYEVTNPYRSLRAT